MDSISPSANSSLHKNFNVPNKSSVICLDVWTMNARKFLSLEDAIIFLVIELKPEELIVVEAGSRK